MDTKKGISQKKINILIFTVFTIAVTLAVISTIYIYSCNKKVLEIEQYKSKCEELSGQLVEKSSYLTEVVRDFVINHDMEALHNYWNEIQHVRTIEKVIAQLEKMNMPSSEIRLLNVAKEYSDLYSYTDIRAMRLILDTIDEEERWLPSQLQDYVLNIMEKEMKDEEKKTAALQLLFNEQYLFEKETIMDNVELFQQTMQQRLNTELLRSRKMTSSAMGILFILLGIILSLVFLILLIFARMVMGPIQSYSDTLNKSADMKYPFLSPSGSEETRLFAKAFNELLVKLQEASAAKSIFVSTVSHEIRTPLNTITGYEYLLADTGLSERQKDYMNHIQLASRQLTQIVNNVLDYSKLEQNRYQVENIDFNVQELCEEICQIFYQTAEKKGIYLKLSMACVDIACIRGDEGKLRQILINLISNGIKFTSEGGVRVTVKTQKTPVGAKEREQPKEGVIEPDIQLTIHVEDTGIGIKEEQKDIIFSAFEQADASVSRKYGGTGLGLAITEQMVQLMKGTIHLVSQVQRGSIFTVRLPMQKSAKNEIDLDKKGLQVKYEGMRVLLVEDDEINQRMEGEILQKYGLQVDFASTGEESIIKAKEVCYDIIFMDIRMSKMNGYMAAEAIRQEGMNRKSMIVALSADTGEKVMNKAFESDMQAYLTKPIELESLRNVLDAAYKTIDRSGTPLLNKNRLWTTLQGNEKLYVELLITFIKKYREDFEKLCHIDTKTTLTSVSDLLHRLKGITGTIGAECLQEVLQSAEKIIFSEVNTHQIWVVYIETCNEIKTYLSRYDGMEEMIEQEGSKAGVSEEEFSENVISDDREHRDVEEVIASLQSALENGALTSMDILAYNQTLIKKKLGTEDYKRLEYAIQHFDWDMALRAVRKEVL